MITAHDFASGWNLANSQTYSVAANAELPLTHHDTNASKAGWQGSLTICVEPSTVAGCTALQAQISDNRSSVSALSPLNDATITPALLCAAVPLDLPDGVGGSNNHQVTLTTTVYDGLNVVRTLNHTLTVNSAILSNLQITGAGAKTGDRRATNLIATWVSPGTADASSYQVIFSPNAIDPVSFGTAVNEQAGEAPVVGATGTIETAQLTGAAIETGYRVGVKVTDAGGAVNYTYTTVAATPIHFNVAYLPALESNVNYGTAVDGSASLTTLTSVSNAAADLVVGGSYSQLSATFATKVGIYRGPRTFSIANPFLNSPDVTLTYPGTAGASVAFGVAVSNVHDLDNDGYRELVIGAPSYDGAAPDSIYIYRGGPTLTTGVIPTWTIRGAGIFATSTGLGTAVADAYDLLGSPGVAFNGPFESGLVGVIPASALCTPVGSPATCTTTMSASLGNAYYAQVATSAQSLRSFNAGNGIAGLLVGEPSANSKHGRLSFFPASAFAGSGPGAALRVGNATQTFTPVVHADSSNEQWGYYPPAVMVRGGGEGWMLPSNGPGGQTRVGSFSMWGAGAEYTAVLGGTALPYGSFIQGGLLTGLANGDTSRTFNYVARGNLNLAFGVTDASKVPHLVFWSQDKMYGSGAEVDLAAGSPVGIALSPPVTLPTWIDFAANPLPAADLDGDGHYDLAIPAIDPGQGDFNGYVIVVY